MESSLQLEEFLRQLIRTELVSSQSELLSVNEAAAFLKIKRSYMYQLIATGKIVSYVSEGGKLVYFQKSDLLKWALHSKRGGNREELKNEAITYAKLNPMK